MSGASGARPAVELVQVLRRSVRAASVVPCRGVPRTLPRIVASETGGGHYHRDNTFNTRFTVGAGSIALALLAADHIFNEKRFFKAAQLGNTQELRRSTPDVVQALRGTDNIFAQSQLWGILMEREGPMYEVGDTTALSALKALYQTAGVLRHWRAVRYCSSLLSHTVDSISPFITTVLVNGKQLTVGVIGQKETVFDKPMTPGEIQSVMYSTIQPYDVIGAVLQQEIVLYCGRLIGTNPDMFRGILKIRVGWVLEALRIYLRLFPEEGRADGELASLSPYRLRTLLIRVLTVTDWADERGLTPLQRRQLEGCLCRVPKHFYIQVWDILLRTPQGIIVQGECIPAQPTLVNMSRSELSFALQVEAALVRVEAPARRQLCVELLCVLAAILRRNPELYLRHPLHLDRLLDDAQATYAKDSGVNSTESLASAPAPVSVGYLARAVVNSVLQGAATDLVPTAHPTCLVS